MTRTISRNLHKNELTGTFDVEVEERFTMGEGLCYIVSSSVELDDGFGGVIGFKVEFTVPPDEVPDELNLILGAKHDYNPVSYKDWPGTKSFRKNIRVGDVNVINLKRQNWRLYSENVEKKCIFYENEGSYFKCLALELYKLSSERSEICLSPS